ncbi:hypothetical protein [Neptuniibacter sp.]|uniref:hypothetical protein n=1 Tax=Neptuniibacter sp. TaxID=1962643 RepID=UPI002611BA23|nr:hypothetical protein [Neptuniibacter sp.]MCP4596227.1 hypothetical protein [Neptuniibacter sp.]
MMNDDNSNFDVNWDEAERCFRSDPGDWVEGLTDQDVFKHRTDVYCVGVEADELIECDNRFIKTFAELK